mmetsp:Transcript_6706/g.9738  ORF Transcript_6706/g.9738 Transcript_6706/m.9738 type:complete len:578 (+) Transcript_6706:56-1789(+)
MTTFLRDDSALRSLSSNERSFVHNCATATSESEHAILRLDGRHPGELRSIRLTFGRTHFGRSECTVQLGLTRVCCIVTCDLVPPQLRPNDGSIKFTVDLSAMAAMGFSSSLDYDENKKHMANRIARVIEKAIVDGGAIDVESLCVVGGTWVWRINVDITALDHGGNLVDASMLAAIAALRHFRKPEVILASSTEEGDDPLLMEANRATGTPIVLSSDEKEPTPLPLHHSPVCVSFGLFGDPTGASLQVAALIDPSEREELVMDGCITYAFNKYGELCGLDFPGGCELRQSQLVQCANLAEKKAVELCNMLEEALESAEDKSRMERVERLKLSSSSTETLIHKAGINDETGLFSLPELLGAPPIADPTANKQDSETTLESEILALAEEEKYRLQALDYALGHVAVKVKENAAKEEKVIHRNERIGGSLIDAMIRSAESNALTTTPSAANNDVSTTMIRQDDVRNIDPSTVEDDKMSASRKKELADEEFRAYASVAQQEDGNTLSRDVAMELDDEEEECITILQPEFAIEKSSIAAKVHVEEVSLEVGEGEINDDMEDVDLSMAVIKRKSKGSRKKVKK